MKRIERLYAVHDAIRRSAPRPVSAATLAERFGVSRRTIERDLDALRKAGAPLYATHGHLGGQHTLEDSSRVLLTLSVAEIASLVVALSVSGHDLPFGESGRAAVERMLDAAPEGTHAGIEQLRTRIRTSRQRAKAMPDQIRRVIEQGVLEQRVLNLTYIDASGARSERSVDPVGIVHDGSRWSLVGWCHTKRAGRMFRFERIETAHLTTQSAEAHDVDETLGWVPFDAAAP